MPVVGRFYGIIIRMYPNDHMPPHFHAIYGEYIGMFDINKLQLLEGDLPIKARNLVEEWASVYKSELLKMWENKEFRLLESF